MSREDFYVNSIEEEDINGQEMESLKDNESIFSHSDKVDSSTLLDESSLFKDSPTSEARKRGNFNSPTEKGEKGKPRFSFDGVQMI